MPQTHYLRDDERVHYTWDTGHEPVLGIDSGDTVVVSTRDVSDNQIGRGSDSSAIADLNWAFVYPLSGPITVAGAEPGDTLAVEVLDIRTQGWGWTAILPGLGLLSDDFPDAYLRVFDISNGDFAFLREDVAIPLAPFFGTMGVCPAGASAQPVMPPGDLRRQPRHAPARPGLDAGPVDPVAAVPHAGAAHAAHRRRAVLRDDRHRRRSLRGGTGGGQGDGGPHRRDLGPEPGGRIRARVPVRRPEDLRDRGRRPVRGQRPAPGGGLPAGVTVR
jgi:acetamidase/formamidase